MAELPGEYILEGWFNPCSPRQAEKQRRLTASFRVSDCRMAFGVVLWDRQPGDKDFVSGEQAREMLEKTAGRNLDVEEFAGEPRGSYWMLEPAFDRRIEEDDDRTMREVYDDLRNNRMW